MTTNIETTKAPEHLDFKNKKDEASKWTETKAKEWHKILRDKKLIKNVERFIKFDHDIINEYLRVTQGKQIKKIRNFEWLFQILSRKFNDESWMRDDRLRELNDEINDLERALSYSKLKTPLKVYLRIDSIYKELFIENQINPEYLATIEANYANVTNPKYNFLMANLTYDGNHKLPMDKYPLFFEFILPKETEVGFLNNLHNQSGWDIIVNRGYSWKQGGAEIITLNGQQNVKIKVQLIKNDDNTQGKQHP